MEKVFEDPNQKVRVTFLSTGPGQATIELVEPAGPDAPVQRFLNERGGGVLHHVCYEVPDVQEQLVTMRARGAMIAKKPKPAVAFDGRLIAWVITAERLLIEYVEAPRASEPVSVSSFFCSGSSVGILLCCGHYAVLRELCKPRTCPFRGCLLLFFVSCSICTTSSEKPGYV